MKITISLTVDTPAEAREVLAAVDKLATLPYRMDGYGASIVRETPPAEIVVEDSEIEVETRKNVSPGPSTIGKIGSQTKADIIQTLASQKQPAAKFSEHLKLLWSRGEVKYDGNEFYL